MEKDWEDGNCSQASDYVTMKKPARAQIAIPYELPHQINSYLLALEFYESLLTNEARYEPYSQTGVDTSGDHKNALSVDDLQMLF